MKLRFEHIALIVIAFILLFHFRGCKEIDTSETRTYTDTISYRDTIITNIVDTTNFYKSISYVDTVLFYDTILHGNKYYSQIFEDTNYRLNTYGGFVDSINLIVNRKDTTFYDSTIVNNTIIKTKYKPYKYNIGVEYTYSGYHQYGVYITRNFGRFSVTPSIGVLDLSPDNKLKPYVGIGVGVSFN